MPPRPWGTLPQSAYWLLSVFIEVHGIAEVCVALDKLNLLHFSRMGSGVFENVQPIANVNGVYQPVIDDRIAPEHSLVVAAVFSLAHGRFLIGYRGRSRRRNRWNKESRLTRMG